MTEGAIVSVVDQKQDARTIFGFWVYLMTDCILFATLFATYIVLHNGTYGGLPGSRIFSLPLALAQTMILLTSSFSCGLGMVAARRYKKGGVILAFAISFLLGAAFIGLEIHEFWEMVKEGNSWRRSGFLTAFFSLVGTHGCHVTIGLLWMLILLPQVAVRGLGSTRMRRLICLSTYWHFLDIVWIFLFTVVYLMAFV